MILHHVFAKIENMQVCNGVQLQPLDHEYALFVFLLKSSVILKRIVFPVSLLIQEFFLVRLWQANELKKST